MAEPAFLFMGVQSDPEADAFETRGGKVYDSTRHGENCAKAPHEGSGYLHAEDDDTPFDVDGCWYCGRCHYSIARPR